MLIFWIKQILVLYVRVSYGTVLVTRFLVEMKLDSANINILKYSNVTFVIYTVLAYKYHCIFDW